MGFVQKIIDKESVKVGALWALLICLMESTKTICKDFKIAKKEMVQRKAHKAHVSNEEQQEMSRNLEKRETEFMRLQRHKVGINDIEPLTLIGKGAFGEVILFMQNVVVIQSKLGIELRDFESSMAEEGVVERGNGGLVAMDSSESRWVFQNENDDSDIEGLPPRMSLDYEEDDYG